MTVTKDIISKNISLNSSLPLAESKKILNSFITLISSKSLNNSIKISGFGTFLFKHTPERVGRNPKTNKSYIICSRNRLTLKVSNKLKIFLN